MFFEEFMTMESFKIQHNIDEVKQMNVKNYVHTISKYLKMVIKLISGKWHYKLFLLFPIFSK